MAGRPRWQHSDAAGDGLAHRRQVLSLIAGLRRPRRIRRRPGVQILRWSRRQLSGVCPHEDPHRSPSLSLDMEVIERVGGPVPARFSLPCHPNTSRTEQEKAMYAVVVRERGQADQINTSGQHVQANVLPRARQAPGIVSGFWMTDMAGATLNVMVFESEDAARSALEPVRTAPRPPSMQVESADVYEVLAHF